ncbi:CsbD family protein [Streptomyces sp. SID8379]|uniref:CsbD family protein n=1 Tax=unclassified Streptomyces TaxID=2593676 RepID=UPI00037CF94E|nr:MULTISPECIES: CsbD family protein [unclassified Streptomyces]MYW63056.1 CsbD family protein [Streptomyces sp. SID8379]
MGENAMDKAKGKAKEMLGKASGNERMKTEGKVDQAKADAEKMRDKAKDKVEGVRDSLTDRD